MPDVKVDTSKLWCFCPQCGGYNVVMEGVPLSGDSWVERWVYRCSDCGAEWNSVDDSEPDYEPPNEDQEG